MMMIDPDFEALKALTRLQWTLNFEALATVGNDEDALFWKSAPARAN
ncbi:MAG TPA: hypothetical protein VFE23_05555 [Usitatibacter sp.]|jgi:hypothetical protein|nr:hypothetical protein [Usitatibacter sp.]